MPAGFNFSDLQHLLAIKFCFYFFVFFGIISIWKKWPTWRIIALAGLLNGLAYFFLVKGATAMFWGLQGDELTIAAMFESFAHKSFWADFAYGHLPPFYPPLYFWVFAVIGKVADLNGVQIAKLASASMIAILPIILYWPQKLFWKNKQEEDVPNPVAWAVLPFIIMILIDWDAMILKPYEVVAAAATVLWISFILHDISRQLLNWKKIIAYGISGGIIFMTYYLWLIFGAIAFALYGLSLKKGEEWKYYSRLLAIALIALAAALPFLWPLLKSYSKYGSENWQVALLTAKGVALHFSMFAWFSWRGFILLGGLFSLLAFWRFFYVRGLLCLFLSAYVWHAMGLATVLFFRSPVQEFKGFDFFDRVVLAFAFAFAVGYVWEKLKQKKYFSAAVYPIAIISFLFASTQMLFGFFVDDPLVQERMILSKTVKPAILELADFLKSDPDNLKKITLSSGVPQVQAFVPLNLYIYYNQHNSHPAAAFSAKKAYLDYLAVAKTSAELSCLAKNAWYAPIDRFIFYKDKNSADYPIFFNLDDFPNGSKETSIGIPKKLFALPDFETVYENSSYIVIERGDNI